MTAPYVLGFDPDLHNSGIAVVRREGDSYRVVALAVAKVPRTITHDAAVLAMVDALPRVAPDYVVVEGQEAYRGRSGARAKPEDLIRLAHVAGAALRLYGNHLDLTHKEIVLPKVWKKQTKKEWKHARICTALGWASEPRAGWALPTGPEPERLEEEFNIYGKQWSHVLDAIGLAIWKLEQLAEKGYR
ncbi:MAG: hypothetical protein LC123_02445 [Burkholderiales bacterium]|nr:hypothetical protein [Burkholderiales bacterium]